MSKGGVEMDVEHDRSIVRVTKKRKAALTRTLVTAVLFMGLTSFIHCLVQMSHTRIEPSSEPET
jgi:hypothetical protein